jgi:hypothetical protein
MTMPLSERQRQALADAASASGHPSGSVTVSIHVDGRCIADELRRLLKPKPPTRGKP